MAAPLTKTTEERMRRRASVSELYVEGHSMAQIGGMIGVSHDTVFRDIQWCREEWRTRAADAIEKHKQNELAKIDIIESEAWRGWKRSIGIHTKTSEKSGEKPGDQGRKFNETITHTEKLAGDPRFLEVINKQIENRRKILGLDAPVKSTVELENASALIAEIQQRREKLAKDKEANGSKPDSDTGPA